MAPNLFLCGGCAGVLAGILELGYVGFSSGWPRGGSSLLIVAVTASLFGLCGLVYGAALQLISRLSAPRLPGWVRALLVLTAAAVAASRYKPSSAAIIALALLGGMGWAWWRATARSYAVVLTWSILLYVLHPLFNGHAMDRVFTEAENFAIFLMTIVLLPLLAMALTAALKLRLPASMGSTLLTVAMAILAAVTLTVCSSVFLVRLWGFNTMQYLEVTLLALKIGCLLIGVTAAVAAWPPGFQRPRREANLIMVLVLLVLFFISGYTGMRRDPTARLFLAQLPDTSFLANGVANLLDRDRDGYSAAFGFGDCDDADANVNPGAVDWPGDGIDQNCFGGDLRSTKHAYFNLPIAVEPPPPRSTPPARRKVVVVVLLDTLRADAVDYAGGPGSITPELAKIASRSLRFDAAYAQSNNTLESMPFLFHLGFRDLPRYHEPWTLPSQFKAGGVASEGIFQSSQLWWLSELDSVLMGFDAKLYPDEQIGYRTNQETAALAVERLAAHSDKTPFFLWVHFEALHDSFTQLMEGERMRSEGINISELVRLWQIQKMVALMKERYLATLADVDRAMGVLWAAIERLEADADVMLIITSDHGEEFYDHGGLFHMGTLHEELVRVPLIVYRTGGRPRVESAPVGLYRIPPTVLKWFDYRGQFLDEMDLLREPLRPYEIFGYFSFAEEWERRTFMIVEDGYKLIYDTGDGRLELYNLTDDPHEHRNLVGVPAEREAERRLTEKMDTTMFFMNYGDVGPAAPPGTQ